MLGHITSPSAPGGLDRRELPDPEPGPHEALVAVRAYAINRGELSLLEQRTDGWLPGQDVAGEVVAQAADGSGPPAGTRVVGLCDWEGWAERAAVPVHRMAALPDNVSFAAASAVPVAGLTASSRSATDLIPSGIWVDPVNVIQLSVARPCGDRKSRPVSAPVQSGVE